MSDETSVHEYDLVIVGGGPAGATAAMYAARADLRTAVIDKGLTAGALGITSKIANYPGIVEELTGAELLAQMRAQAEQFGATFITDKVQAVDLTSETKSVYGNAGTYTGKAIIIATGSMGRGKRIPGEDTLLGRGVSYCATCDAAFFRGQTVAVAGNSDEAIEEALFLTKFAEKVYLFSPTNELKAPAHVVREALENPKLDVQLSVTVREVVGTTQVEGLKITRRASGESEVVAVTGAFFYLQGGVPITDFLYGQLPTSESGCLVVDGEYRTALPGVYAVGDVLCNHVKQAVVAAAEGAVAGMAVEKEIRGRKKLAVDWS